MAMDSISMLCPVEVPHSYIRTRGSHKDAYID
jgi:hypothetical protein